jgi:hypothetical protein
MIDPDWFWTEFDECQRRVRATLPVVALRHDITPGQRVTVALQSLTESIRILRSLRDSVRFDVEEVRAIDDAETELRALAATLRARIGTQSVLAGLAGIFGRAPT